MMRHLTAWLNATMAASVAVAIVWPVLANPTASGWVR